MKRKVIGSLLAVILAATGTFVLISYVRGAESRALAGERVVPVLVATQEIPKGTPADQLEGRIALEQVPQKVQATGSVDTTEDLKGKVAAVDLLPGEQLVEARFQTPEVLAQEGGVEVPDGLQEVTIRLQPERALGGELLPGDTVGVVASFAPFSIDGAQPEEGEEDDTESKTPNTTHVIFHKVLVTNVQAAAPVEAEAPVGGDNEEEEGPQKSPPPTGEVFVTLAVNTNAVEKLVFTAEFGTLWLTDEPEAAEEKPSKIETRGTIYE